MDGDKDKHGTGTLFLKLIKSNAARPVLFVQGEACAPFEYRCGDCGQLRLSLVTTTVCANCSSKNITKGDIGTL